MEIVYVLVANIAFSVFAFISTYNIIPRLKDMFISANLYGKDLNKKSENKMWVLFFCHPNILNFKVDILLLKQ